MRNPVFKKITPNYRKRVLEIALREGSKTTKYNLPFSAFGSKKIHSKNRFTAIALNRQLGGQAASFVLEDGTTGDFPADFVLYHCDLTYDWSPINQLKKALKDKLGASQLSVRVMAEALNTSLSQAVRLLREDKISKHLVQLLRLAELAGYRVEFNLKKKAAE